MSSAQAETDAFLKWLAENEGYFTIELEPDGLTYWGIKRLLFHWTLVKGSVGNYEWYDDRWCYQTQVLAEHALAEFKGRGFAGEPTGWHRHPATGRRRTGGNPATEYIAY